jgi:Spy/CpxP family protein refolding chaperone/outer membrane murein-binding lipoprotein Lpp
MYTRVASFPGRFGLGQFGRRFKEVVMQRTFPPLRHRALAVTVFIVSSAVIAAHQSIMAAQAPTQSAAQTATQDQLARQIEELRAQVARLQTALDQQRQPAPAPSTMSMPTQPAPAGMDKMEMGKMRPGGMSMGDMDRQKMDKMPQGGMGMMDMHKGEMGMPPEGMKMPGCCMMDEMGRMSTMPSGSGTTTGTMPSSGAMVMPGVPAGAGAGAPRSMSSLPGVPGASHLYHIGSTGFFLDQPMVTLSGDQQSALNKIKERALLDRSNAERRVEQAEQELWTLTGADQPDAAKVQAKAREIEQIRTNQRLAFIQAIGEATKILTAEQRTHLLGMANMPAK